MKTTIHTLIQRACTTVPGDSPFLDALVLMEWATGIPRANLLAELQTPVPDFPAPESDWQERFETAIRRRSPGYPVAYITGEKEFFGRSFFVNEDVLIPRPDTEVLVEQALRVIDTIANTRTESAIRVHDCCTGSGCIAITIAAQTRNTTPPVTVTMSDASSPALDVAARNARAILGYELDGWKANILCAAEPGKTARFDVITANPPYLTATETTDALALGWKEPECALNGGPDGLRLISLLLEQIPASLAAGGALLVECAPLQVPAIEGMMYEHGFSTVEYVCDLGGHPRVVVGEGFQIDNQY